MVAKGLPIRRTFLVVLAALGGGCGGEFTLTAPDVAGVPGKLAPAVIRLQRSEVWVYAPPCKQAAVTFQLDKGQVRSARTDNAGYAAVTIELPARPGAYAIALHHMNTRGDVVTGTGWAYVLEAARPVAAVDADSIPLAGAPAAEAAAAVARLAEEAQIVYTTEDFVGRGGKLHRQLSAAGYPDGPVLPSAKVHPWYDRRSWVRSAELHPLTAIKDSLPELRWGLTADDDAARTYRKAGLRVLAVGDASARGHADEFFKTWQEVRLTPP